MGAVLPDPNNGPTDEFYLPDAAVEAGKTPSSQPEEAIIDHSRKGEKNSRG